MTFTDIKQFFFFLFKLFIINTIEDWNDTLRHTWTHTPNLCIQPVQHYCKRLGQHDSPTDFTVADSDFAGQNEQEVFCHI